MDGGVRERFGQSEDAEALLELLVAAAVPDQHNVGVILGGVERHAGGQQARPGVGGEGGLRCEIVRTLRGPTKKTASSQINTIETK